MKDITCIFLITFTFPLLYGASDEGEPSASFNGITPFEWSCPYMVSIQVAYGFKDTFHHVCTGVLVHHKQVITAVHCIEIEGLEVQPKDIKVYAGAHNLNRQGVYLRVSKIFHHLVQRNDPVPSTIAVLQLRRSVTYSRKIYGIGIASTNFDSGTPCVVNGWGYIAFGVRKATNVLLQSSVNIEQVCEDDDNSCGNSSIINVRYNQFSDNCTSDFGMALICRGKLYGIATMDQSNCSSYHYLPYSKLLDFEPWNIALYSQSGKSLLAPGKLHSSFLMKLYILFQVCLPFLLSRFLIEFLNQITGTYSGN